MAGFGTSAYDEEAQRQRVKILFTDEKIRRDFIGKVYTILMCQIGLSVGFMVLTTFHEPTRIWLMKHWWMMLIAFMGVLICMCALMCGPDSMRKQPPMNYILLFIFTACEALILGVTTLFFPSRIILLAIGITAIVFLALTIFALVVPVDFTVCYGFLTVVLVLFFIFAMVAMFFQSRTLEVVKASIGVVIFSMYIIIDTQMMMGGNHTYVISPEDYIIAAISLYIDIVNMFLFILTLLSSDD